MFRTIFFKSHYVFLFAVFFLLASCGSSEDVVYFQNAKNFDSTVDTDTFTARFKVNDIVSIYVSAFDMDAVRPFNLFKGAQGASSSTVEFVDYLIDQEGNIDYPILGKVKLLGLSVEEAKELFKNKLADYVKDPIVNIRILNFRISVLGEVNRPGQYNVSGERITLLEAMSLAGDLKIKARRDNVLVVRNFNGAKVYTRVDLRSTELFNSPVYYLTQNDVVYVEPNKSAISASYLDARVGLMFSVFSLLVTTTVIIATR